MLGNGYKIVTLIQKIIVLWQRDIHAIVTRWSRDVHGKGSKQTDKTEK
jgi:hypothetical protein